MRWVYISPHFDDAVFSAGSIIFDQVRSGDQVEIWTMFSGSVQFMETSELADKLQKHWGFRSASETFKVRCMENRAAAKMLGALDVNFDFIDCIYRQGRDGQWLYPENTFLPPCEEDLELVVTMSTALTAHLSLEDIVVCPLAIGGHVDHVLTRKAVEAMDRPFWYYSDVPYLFHDERGLSRATVGLQAKIHKTSVKGLFAWWNASLAYRSQISMEFENAYQLWWMMTKYGWYGVSLWKRDYAGIIKAGR